MMRILVLCTGNSARSQMGEGLFREEGRGEYEVESAGTKPSYVRPEAIAVMKELGIDISGHRSKSVTEFEGQSFDYVVTVCDNARDSCPLFPAGTERIHWSFEDPAAVEGNEEERLGCVPPHSRSDSWKGEVLFRVTTRLAYSVFRAVHGRVLDVGLIHEHELILADQR